MNDNNFIGFYQAEEVLCDDIIDFYNQHKKYAIKGLSAKSTDEINTDINVKDSIDLAVSARHLYYPMDEYRKHLQESLDKYIKIYIDANNYSRFKIVEDYNIQHYSIGGGFKTWHFESNSPSSMRRILVFMTYLNDVPDGGTIFKYQNIITPAKKGSTVIWPAGFTHTHKGQISHTKEKFIVTGWWSLIDE